MHLQRRPTQRHERCAAPPAKRFSWACLIRATVLAPLLLTGCQVGPDFAAPAFQPPAAFAAAPASDGGQAMALAKWWDLFHDPALSGRIDKAMANAPDLRQAVARVNESRALAQAAGATLWPSLDARTSYSFSESYSYPHTKLSPSPKGTLRAGLDASWELDIWGVNRRGIEAATADAVSADFQAQAVRLSLVAEVARQEFLARGLAARMRVLKQNIENQNETLEMAVQRRKSGFSNEAAVAQARAQLAGLQARVPPLREALAAAENRLAVLMGESPGAVRVAKWEARHDAPAIPAMPSPPSAIPSEALRRRPDVASAAQALHAATARIGVAEGDLYPRLTLSGVVGVTGAGVDDLFHGGTPYYSIAPSVQWRVFDRRQIKARVAAAGARAERALAEHDKAVLAALEEVENAFVSMETAGARIDALEKAVLAAEYSTAISTRQYGEGLGNFVSVLLEQQRLFESREQLEEAKLRQGLAFVSLCKALGGGWEPPPKNP